MCKKTRGAERLVAGVKEQARGRESCSYRLILNLQFLTGTKSGSSQVQAGSMQAGDQSGAEESRCRGGNRDRQSGQATMLKLPREATELGLVWRTAATHTSVNGPGWLAGWLI